MHSDSATDSRERNHDGDRRAGPWGRAAWAAYDWANSAFFAVIQTFVFAAYFTRQVASDPERSTFLWGMAVGVAGLVVAVAGPILGAVADRGGRRKPWIAATMLLSVTATCGLWFVGPSERYVLPALVLVAAGAIGAELSLVFYNAMLPNLVPPERIGRWSGWGWSAGYAGGLACLAVALFVFVLPQNPPFGLEKESAQEIRATCLLTGAWFLIFSLPLFIFTPATRGAGERVGEAVTGGLRQVRETFRQIRQYRPIVRFLIARWVYTDGLAALFAFGGVYAAGTFDMTEKQVLLFGIAINVTAAVGAAGFSWIDDWIGGKRTVLIALLGMAAPGTAILLVDSQAWFWVLGLAVGIFVGPAQAAGRSLMGRLAPDELRTQMFGFYALSGKATAFLAPLLVAWVTRWSGNQRIGMAVIMVYLAVAFVLMLRVPGREKTEAAGT